MSFVLRLVKAIRRPVTLLPLAAFGLCGSGPVPKGSEVSAGLGAGPRHYQTGGGCAGALVDHHTVEYAGNVAASHHFESGWTVSGEASMLANDPTRKGDTDERDELGAFNVRGGYDFEHAGFQLGPSFWALADDETTTAPAFSANTWVGEQRLYLYANLLAGPVSLIGFPLGVGLGHQGEDLRLEVGIVPGNARSYEVCPAAHLDGRYRVEKIWLGLGADVCDAETFRGTASVGYAFGD